MCRDKIQFFSSSNILGQACFQRQTKLREGANNIQGSAHISNTKILFHHTSFMLFTQTVLDPLFLSSFKKDAFSPGHFKYSQKVKIWELKQFNINVYFYLIYNKWSWVNLLKLWTRVHFFAFLSLVLYGWKTDCVIIHFLKNVFRKFTFIP